MISTPSAASRAPSHAQSRLASSRSRSRAPRLRLVLTWFFVLACLTSTVLAQGETYATSLQHRRHHVAPINRYELHRRGGSSKDEDDDEEPDRITDPEAPAKDGSSKTKPTTTTATIQRAAATAASTNSPLPQAFDGNLAADLITTSDSNCPSFLNGILADPSFRACYPLSMMLQVGYISIPTKYGTRTLTAVHRHPVASSTPRSNSSALFVFSTKRALPMSHTALSSSTQQPGT